MSSNVKIDDRVWKKIKKKVEKAGMSVVKVGVLSEKGGGETTDGGITLAILAAIHEYGSPKNNIPGRSFIRSAFKKNKRELEKVTAKLANKMITTGISVEQTLDTLGLWGSTAVKNHVTTGENIKPDILAATKAAKGSSRPLVDTGRMIGAVSWAIERKVGGAQ